MSIFINIKVNGDYECPIVYEQNGVVRKTKIRGHHPSQIASASLPFYHGAGPMTVTIGPEKYLGNVTKREEK